MDPTVVSLIKDANILIMQVNSDITGLQEMLKKFQDAIQSPTLYTSRIRQFKIVCTACWKALPEKIRSLEDTSLPSFLVRPSSGDGHAPEVEDMMDRAEAVSMPSSTGKQSPITIRSWKRSPIMNARNITAPMLKNIYARERRRRRCQMKRASIMVKHYRLSG